MADERSCDIAVSIFDRVQSEVIDTGSSDNIIFAQQVPMRLNKSLLALISHHKHHALAPLQDVCDNGYGAGRIKRNAKVDTGHQLDPGLLRVDFKFVVARNFGRNVVEVVYEVFPKRQELSWRHTGYRLCVSHRRLTICPFDPDFFLYFVIFRI